MLPATVTERGLRTREAFDGRNVHLVLVGRIATGGFVRHAHGRGGHFHGIEFGGQRLHHHAEAIQIAGQQQFADGTLGHVQSARLHVERRGHGADVDLLLGERLDVAKQAVFARRGQRDGHALAASATRAADAVHVALGRGGHVEVDHVREVIDVDAARRHIGGHQQIHHGAARLLHHAIALGLRHAAVQCLHAIAATHQPVGQLVHIQARAAEDERQRG